MLCDNCFEATALEGETLCQTCLDKWTQSELKSQEAEIASEQALEEHLEYNNLDDLHRFQQHMITLTNILKK